MQVISLSTGFMGNGVREGQYSGEGALRWPSERVTEVEFMTLMFIQQRKKAYNVHLVTLYNTDPLFMNNYRGTSH